MLGTLRAAVTLFAACLTAAASAQPVTPNPAERRAVRGAPLDEGSESPELREVRRFEEESFPRGGLAIPDAVEEGTAPLPPGLEGRWAGSGDLPPQLRSPPAFPSRLRNTPPPESQWLRTLKLPELPVRWEPQVVRYLEYYKNDPKGRAVMAALLRKMERYRAVFDRVLASHGVPKDLIYLAMFESGFENGATSRVGAGGIWQFMPGVARAYGLEVSYWVDARRDPERAAEAAARYFQDLFARFGSWHLAFAAYHAGYGAILRSITRFNTNDYWELCKHENGLPWETTLYVPRILAGAIVGYNREAFGFGDVTTDPPWQYETVQVAPATALAAVARTAGARPEVIEALNPELIRGRTPPDRGPLSVRVPPGSAALYAEAMARPRGGESLETVVLRFGESLDEVARARGISARELRRLNGVKDSAELRGGTTIVVPARPATASAPAPSREPPPATGVGTVTDDEMILVAVPERVFTYEGRERVFYRTREGDTLDEIAAVFHLPIAEIVEWNNIDPEAKLHPQLVLQLFVAKDFDRAGVALLDPGKVRVVTLGSQEFLALETARRGKTRLQYVAKSGDTLAKIARRYGLYAGDLARINRLSAAAELAPGQTIVVYSPTPELPREIAVGRTAPQRRPPVEARGTASSREGARPADKKRSGTPAPRGSGTASGTAAARGSAKAPAMAAAKPAAGKPGTPQNAKPASPGARPASRGAPPATRSTVGAKPVTAPAKSSAAKPAPSAPKR